MKRSKQRNVHMWVGKGASQDKAAAMSIRGVMLCNYLQGQVRLWCCYFLAFARMWVRSC